jgi:hypothetical protein
MEYTGSFLKFQLRLMAKPFNLNLSLSNHGRSIELKSSLKKPDFLDRFVAFSTGISKIEGQPKISKSRTNLSS